MNIEESVEYLKNCLNDEYNFKNATRKKDKEAIETLLTAYEKEKGENVKLRLQDIPLIEGELKAYKDRVNELKEEIEKEKEKNKKTNKYIEDRAKIGKDIQTFINKDYVEQEYISKDKMKEILGIEETDSEKILSLLQTIVDENARLEDIEDRKVQIEYNNVFNKGVKSVEDKIKAKIEEVQNMKAKAKDIVFKSSLNYIETELQSLLEKE